MIPGLSALIAILLPALAASPAGAAVFSELPVADSFLRAAIVNGNYGGGGSLSVSGAEATGATDAKNGVFDSFLQFSTATSSTAFNAEFGAGQWRITGASLQLTSVASPGNAIFNTGPGDFSIRWIARDDWQEGTGKPTAPETTSITWAKAALLFTPGTDEALGQFHNPGTDTTLNLTLSLPVRFVTDLTAGGPVTFRLSAVDATTGFNFRSRDFTGAGAPNALPHLILTAEAIPEPACPSLILLGGSLLLRRGRSVRPACQS